MVTLTWKSFSIPVDRLHKALKTLIGSNYDGLICRSDDFDVVYKVEPTEQELTILNNYWDTVVEQQFNPSLKEIISGKINEASAFGRALILDFAVENVQMGVTQAGKTRNVADYLSNLQRYVESGSLYAAVAEIDSLVNATVPSNLAPFVTSERLLTYKARIVAFLQP